MKTKYFVLALFLSFSSFLFAQNDATTMLPIFNKAQSLINHIENDQNQEIVHIEMDLLANTRSTVRTLSVGNTYSIVAFGDFRFKDIDIDVYRWNGSDWVIMNRDTQAADMAEVTIIPTSTADYKFEVKAYKFNEGFSIGHYGLIISHQMIE